LLEIQMKKYKLIYPLFFMLLSSLSANVFAVDASELEKLSISYGCEACHSITPSTEAKRLPVGPSFAEIAERYETDGRSSYQDLARIIKYGSSPYRSKWRGLVSGLAMPPNDDTITDLDINRLLVGILTLKK
jgi:cytochrome c